MFIAMPDPAVRKGFLLFRLIDRDGRLIKSIPFLIAENVPIVGKLH